MEHTMLQNRADTTDMIEGITSQTQYVVSSVDAIRTTHSAEVPRLNFINSSHNAEAETERIYRILTLVTGLGCYPVIWTFGIAGNICSMVVLCHKALRSSTSCFLFFLAVFDTLKLLNDALYTVAIGHLYTTGSDALFHLFMPYTHYIFNMTMCTSAWLTVVVAAERYILVCHATRSRQLCTPQRACAVCVSIILVMAALTVPTALRYYTAYYFDAKTNSTVFSIHVGAVWRDKTFSRSYTWVHNVIRCVLPILILVFLNASIIRALRRTSLNRRRGSRYRIALTLVAVVVCFLILASPDALLSLVLNYGYHEDSFHVRAIREVTDMLLCANSAVNFFLYFTFNKVFKAQFMQVCCCASVKKHLKYVSAIEATASKARTAATNMSISPSIPLLCTPSPTTPRPRNKSDSRYVGIENPLSTSKGRLKHISYGCVWLCGIATVRSNTQRRDLQQQQNYGTDERCFSEIFTSRIRQSTLKLFESTPQTIAATTL